MDIYIFYDTENEAEVAKEYANCLKENGHVVSLMESEVQVIGCQGCEHAMECEYYSPDSGCAVFDPEYEEMKKISLEWAVNERYFSTGEKPNENMFHWDEESECYVLSKTPVFEDEEGDSIKDDLIFNMKDIVQ